MDAAIATGAAASGVLTSVAATGAAVAGVALALRRVRVLAAAGVAVWLGVWVAPVALRRLRPERVAVLLRTVLWSALAVGLATAAVSVDTAGVSTAALAGCSVAAVRVLVRLRAGVL